MTGGMTLTKKAKIDGELVLNNRSFRTPKIGMSGDWTPIALSCVFKN